MSFLILMILIVLAGLFGLLNKRPWVLSSLFLAIGVIVAVGSGLLPGLLVPFMQSHRVVDNAPWRSSNAIIVLGFGLSQAEAIDGQSVWRLPLMGHSRVLEAFRLFSKCKKTGQVCKMIVSGGDPQGHGISEAEVLSRLFETLGVSSEDLIVESNSLNTFQNARETKLKLDVLQSELNLLVTSGFHLKRAVKYFGHFGVEVLPVPADRLEVHSSIWPNAINFVYFDLLLAEMIGLLRMDVYNFLGWNGPAAK